MKTETREHHSIPQKLPLWDDGKTVIFPFGLEKIPSASALSSDSGYVFLSPAMAGKKEGTRIGTICKVIKKEGKDKERKTLFFQGITRASAMIGGKAPLVYVKPLGDKTVKASSSLVTAKIRSILKKLEELSASNSNLPSPFIKELGSVESPSRFSDILSQQLSLPFEKAVRLLGERDPLKRLDLLSDHLTSELEIELIRVEMDDKTYDEIDKRQREYFLRQQMETIQSELSQGKEAEESEASYKSRLEKLDAPAEVKDYINKEIHRFFRLSPVSEEVQQIKPYLDIFFDLPWGSMGKDNLDLKKVKRLLDKEHYGLKKIKKRILEHLAVSKIGGKAVGRIFCFVGPPGVGKTSLAKAIAESLGKKFVQVSLGGIKDEAEIRGHRRTYIGAMPGRIIQGLRQAKTVNPVFLLDEIDKMGTDFRGDPSSALLEALDPVQNVHFVDNYLGFPFDLSKALFITTANTVDGVLPAFLDRLEIVELNSYTEEEKITIARKHLIGKIENATGVKNEVEIEDSIIMKIIRDYTREAGLRNLERELERIYRSAALKVAEGREFPRLVDEKTLGKILGPPPFFSNQAMKKGTVGIATGLAYTEVGGEIIFSEASVLDGNGSLTMTGQLGEVMKESAQAAMTYIKSQAKSLGINMKLLAKKDIHIHFPEGAIPKDGPSAGITIAVALYSALTRKKVDKETAFTGEITLVGKILPVGGIREKLLAAQRAGIKTIVLPSYNQKDLKEIPLSVRNKLKLVFVDNITEVLSYAFKNESVGNK